MPSPTMTLIQSVTVPSGGASTVTFSSIPQTYTDLKIVASLRGDFSIAGEAILISFNGTSTSTNHSGIYLQGNGASAGSGSLANYAANIEGTINTANTFASNEIYIPNYTSTSAKSFSADGVTETNGTTAYAKMSAQLWNVTGSGSPITSIVFTINNGYNFLQYSSFYLYGVKNA